MRNRKYAMLAGAAVAASIPLTSKAVTITYSYDLPDIQYSTTNNGTYTAVSTANGSLSGTAAAPIITIPSGDFLKIGVDVNVAGDTVAADNFGDSAETLGIAAYQIGLADSNVAVASVTPYASAALTVLSTPVVNANFAGSTAVGDSDGLGGVGGPTAATGTLGSNSFNGLNYKTAMSYGGGTPAELYSSLKIKANGSTGSTATFTLTNNASAFQYVTVQTPGHVTGTSTNVHSTYKNTTYNPVTDSFAALPVLTIKVGTPGATTSQSIISLTAGPTAPTTYGGQVATIALTGNGNGSYVAQSKTIAATATGYASITGFNPQTDQEIYALKLTLPNGVTDANVVADITASETGVTASLVTGVYTSLFPGYDILLSSTTAFNAANTGGGADELGFDFSQDTADPGVTVVGVAAVPEPATAAAIVLGAAGLLLGRRRGRLVIA